jgi:hypothetical protein
MISVFSSLDEFSNSVGEEKRRKGEIIENVEMTFWSEKLLGEGEEGDVNFFEAFN